MGRSRREFIGLALSGLGLAAAGCLSAVGPSAARAAAMPAGADDEAEAPPSVPRVQPTPPTPSAAQELRMLLSGTPWATPALISRANVAGPTMLVLGGVHGNEPGAWQAADQVATWQPRTGTLIVAPHVNVLAIAAGQRTLPELGDLNRLYPGNPGPRQRPMSRMASAIVDLAAEFDVEVLYDMHESWSLFAERPQDPAVANAFLGQTVTAGAGPESANIAKDLVTLANKGIKDKRERLTARTEIPPVGVGSTNSLGVGRFVSNLTTVLVEMAQDRQDLNRRIDLHLLVARTFLQSRGML